MKAALFWWFSPSKGVGLLVVPTATTEKHKCQAKCYPAVLAEFDAALAFQTETMRR